MSVFGLNKRQSLHKDQWNGILDTVRLRSIIENYVYTKKQVIRH